MHVGSSSLTRDQTWDPALGARTHWSHKGSPQSIFFWACVFFLLICIHSLSLTPIFSTCLIPTRHSRQDRDDLLQKWKSVVSDSLWPHGQYSPWNSPGQNTGMGSLSLLQGILPNPGIKPRSPTLQADSLPAEPQGKPKNTGVDSLFLRQRIFPTQELNWGLLHCRWFFTNWAIREAQIRVYQGKWKLSRSVVSNSLQAHGL